MLSGGPAPMSEAVRLATFAMGCRFELVLAGADEAELYAVGEEAVEEIDSLHARLTAFDRSSVVSAINAAAGSSSVRVDSELLSLFALCARVQTASAGAFDVAVGRLMEEQGLRRSPNGLKALPNGSLPMNGAGLVVDEATSTVALGVAGLSLDLGAIGKGFAIDAAIQTIRDAGVTSAIVHAGTSTVAAIGHRPDGGHWQVAIRPTQGAEPLTIDVSDRALSVSGTAEQGEHIVDPRSGERRNNSGICACLAPSAAEADAWSTALFVLGERPATLDAGVTSIVEHKADWRINGDSAKCVRKRSLQAAGLNREADRAAG